MRVGTKIAALLAMTLLVAACGGPIIEGDGGADTTETTDTTIADGDLVVGGAVDTLTDVQDAVVRIVGKGTFADPMGGELANVPGQGSGFVIDESGLAITANHVVTGAAFLDVHLEGEDGPRSAKVVAVSECTDLALIDIDGEVESWLRFYEGDPEPGVEVFAAGFPLGDPEYALTEGVVARAPRPGVSQFASVESEIQHTASTLPGNSGGPLVSPDGEVLGVVYAVRAGGEQPLAIGAADVLERIDTFRAGEDVEALGLNGEAFTDGDLSGIFVYSVETGSPADRAGVQAGDLVTRIEGIDLAADGTMDSYCRILRSHEAGDPLSIQVLRPETGELLEGTVNVDGAELTARSSAMATSDPEAMADTMAAASTVENDAGTLSVQVPETWTELDMGPWNFEGDRVGEFLAAAPDVDAFLNGLRGPGVLLTVSPSLADDHTPASFLDALEEPGAGCGDRQVSDYDDGVYVGVFDSWVGCGAGGTLFRIASQTPTADSLVYLEILVPAASEGSEADLIASTFLAVDPA